MINIIQEHTPASNMDDPKDKLQKYNNIELLQKKEDVSEASPDESPKGELWSKRWHSKYLSMCDLRFRNCDLIVNKYCFNIQYLLNKILD